LEGVSPSGKGNRALVLTVPRDEEQNAQVRRAFKRRVRSVKRTPGRFSRLSDTVEAPESLIRVERKTLDQMPYGNNDPTKLGRSSMEDK